MLDSSTWPIWAAGGVFALSVLAIVLVGTKMTATADRLADRTGLGEALVGAVLLGASTSLSGSVLSVTAAWDGRAELSLGNALGGIAAQTAFLAMADFGHARVNLEHAAASVANIMQSALLVCLLALLLVSPLLPDVTLLGVHPITPVMFATYAGGLFLVQRGRKAPMWTPALTRQTRLDEPDGDAQRASLRRLSATFLAQLAMLGTAGWVMEGAAANLADQTPMTETAIGLLLTSTSTSLPELVTSIAAVRRGALTLAVSGIVGGNAFDTLFAAFSDIAYREGSIYHTMPDALQLWLGGSTLMTGVLLLGLLARQELGPWRIGFESFLILALYGGLVALVIAG